MVTGEEPENTKGRKNKKKMMNRKKRKKQKSAFSFGSARGWTDESAFTGRNEVNLPGHTLLT